MTDPAELRAAANLMRTAEPTDRMLAVCIRAEGLTETWRALSSTARDDGPDNSRARSFIASCAAGFGITVSTEAVTKAAERWKTRITGQDCDADRDLRIMERLGARLIAPGCAEWPQQLDDLGLDAPTALWARGPGNLNDLTSVSCALVGARAATGYGTALAKNTAFELARDRATVISGGAFGIDAAAHAGALAASVGQASTIALMAGGVDRMYPRGNADLLEELCRNHLVVSECPPGATPMRHRFLARNRLIAALSTAVVVVEAGWRSGAINTAHHAAELCRPLGAFPGRASDAESAGCHRLIREGGAVLVAEPDHVRELLGTADVAELFSRESARAQREPADGLSDAELKVFSALPVQRGVDCLTLAVRAGLDPQSTRAALAALELAGLAHRSGDAWQKGR
ncbi:DNA-processing protein DprA [Brevibacterium sp. HMSC063G07]|uniref:DNA-processing protein DprA n=1 Tax=Brevibacterium sp. HMSC063G07 TaxID=1739261 RepID=UPI0008A30507|nr:DNA-processing protein DprA [Brevibacterium sp. HMSC063G07]OFL64810.1 hypothetical protein HMPREF2757_05940 [Brevibacterium sp. HMSC063G07]